MATGQVRWGFGHSGYAGGLEKLGDKIDLASWRKGTDYSRVYPAPESHGCKPVDEWLSVRGSAPYEPRQGGSHGCKAVELHFFAREVAIAVVNSKACQSDPRIKAQNLINRNLLTAQERDYVYG